MMVNLLGKPILPTNSPHAFMLIRREHKRMLGQGFCEYLMLFESVFCHRHLRLMPTTLLIFFFVIVLPHRSMGQWQWKNPLPQGDEILQVEIILPSVAILVPQSPGLLRSTDNGENWELVYMGVSFRRVSFVTSTEGWGVGSQWWSSTQCGIYHTTNGGISWDQQVPDTTELCNDIKFTDARNGWAMGPRSIWRTSDGGDNWIQQDDAGKVRAGLDNSISFKDSLIGWAGGWDYYNVSKTTDGGSSWSVDSIRGSYNRFIFADDSIGWSSASKKSIANDRAPVLRTTNGGLTWLETPEEIFGEAFPLSAETCFVFGYDGVYKTTNSGLLWSKIDDQVLRAGKFINSVQGLAFVGTAGEFFRTTDGGFTWTAEREEMLTTGYGVLRGVKTVESGFAWIIGTDFLVPPGRSFVAKSSNRGETWIKTIDTLTSEALSSYFFDRDRGWVVGGDGLAIRTTDGGDTWSSFDLAIGFDLRDVTFSDSLHGFCVGATPSGTGAAGIILRTADGGLSWDDVTPGLIPRVSQVIFVDSLYGWVSGNALGLGNPPVFFRTTDGGFTWNNPLNDNTTDFNKMFFVDRARGWANAEQVTFGTFSTIDSGKTWQRRNNIGPFYIGAMKFRDIYNGLLVGENGTILKTVDGGVTWTSENQVTIRLLYGVDFFSDGTAVVVGSNNTILTNSNLGLTNVVKDGPRMIPDKIILHPNFPNPFNGSTTLVFETPNDDETVIDVFDILGRRVKSHSMGIMKPGLTHFKFEPSDLGSGVYFYKVRNGTQTATGRFIYLK